MTRSEHRRRRILVVDDDRHQLDIMKRWLERQGFEPLIAENGPAGLELARQGEVDVILLDVMMPEMDGLTVCARLRENAVTRAIPVILLTARDDIDTRVQGMALGVSEYITKPINKQQLLTRLRAQLHSRALQQELSKVAATIDK